MNGRGKMGRSMVLCVLAATAMFAPGCAQATGQAQAWKPANGPLMTRWSKQVSPQNALPEYPRPQMVRKNWLNLNGLWDYALADKAVTQPPVAFNEKILVPYPYESALSGVGKPSIPNQRLWYRRSFSIPAAWKSQKVLLHFGAVNWDSEVWVNGQTIGRHRGGYDGFSFDITSALKPGANELTVAALNPLLADVADAQVLGKQRLKSGGIFYTAATGIWQTVWLEPVPSAHIAALRITPDIDAKVLRLGVQSSAPNDSGSIEIRDGNVTVARVRGKLAGLIAMPIANPRLWTPDNPHLYSLRVTLDGRGGDSVDSYFAMRKISLGKDAQNRTRIFLNNTFVFQVGALDQGYWPDGIYTAPTDAALRYDIEAAKKLGWNLLRKHAKVEPARWYYHADKLGMLVWQDMPSMFAGPNNALSEAAKQQFETEWRRIMAQFHNYPSIVVWTTFNEGWGQHDTERIVALTKQLDPSRLVNNASGWFDRNVGDINDLHVYQGPGSPKPEANRAAVNGEFGGLAMPVPGHRWNTDIFGYGATLQNSWQLTRRYHTLFRDVYKLRDDPGASAVVYTQITDVEQEINGLLTYDRAVIKPDLAITVAANKGVFLPLPPNPNPELVPTSQFEPTNWRYTFERPADNWSQPGFDDAAWKTGPATFGHDAPGVRTQWTTPDIWIRREFTLPTTIPARLAFLVQHDEDAEIYVNGVLAASVTGFTGEYKNVPLNDAGRAALKPGRNTLAVHVRQTLGGQAIDVGIVEVKSTN